MVAHTNLIKGVQLIAHYFVLTSKGEVNGMQDLIPSFGLEMLLPEGTNKLLIGFVSFFSIFQLWHILILAIGFAALAKCGKGKALLITAPDWVIGLVFAVIGALFRK